MECLECLADASLGMLGAVHRVLQGLQEPNREDRGPRWQVCLLGP
jgi:hypothetical protein